MNKKSFIVVLLVLALLTINFSVAQEIENITDEDLTPQLDEEVLAVSDDDVLAVSEEDINDTVLEAAGNTKTDTQITVESNTTFDVIGNYFKVKLSDVDNKTLKSTKVTFTVSDKTYSKTTDSKGIASLQLKLNDGTYKITTKFAGNSNYKASSLTATVKVTNTRVVDEGLSNSQIQEIIDNAKANNIILFKGSSYSNINLVIEKSLTLISNVNTVLQSSSGPVITIKGKSASLTSLKGFDIQSAANGIVISDADYVTITTNSISAGGNGIVAQGTEYLNITKNDITKCSKSGIVLGNTVSTYIFNNNIINNDDNGIEIAKSDKTYIHDNTISKNGGNGIYLSTTVNGVNYRDVAENLYISKNTISNNHLNGIFAYKAGNNININGNTISSNTESGIFITNIGNNKMQSNEIVSNGYVGIKFNDDYVMPENQDISYNVIRKNGHVQIEAKDTYYSENGEQLKVGDNWFSDRALICPKVSSNNIQFVVKQVGENQFQASFIDSDGNIASLLPDRTLTYTTNNGKTYSITVSGGTGVFTVDAKDGDIVSATVDNAKRDNTFNSKTPSSAAKNGQTPTYTYPSIPNYQLYEDIGKEIADDEEYYEDDNADSQTYDNSVNDNGNGNGNGNGGGNGNGDGTGEGSQGNANKGNGVSTHESSDNAGNSTYSQKTQPSSNTNNNQINDVEQSYETEVTASQASASESSAGIQASPAGQAESQSVVKQIIIDEDEFFRVTGMSFIVLVIILTIGFYYRDEIKEMNSKR